MSAHRPLGIVLAMLATLFDLADPVSPIRPDTQVEEMGGDAAAYMAQGMDAVVEKPAEAAA